MLGPVPFFGGSDLGLIPGLGRSCGEGNGNPLQYSSLGDPMDRGAGQTPRGCKRVGPDLATKQQCGSVWPTGGNAQWQEADGEKSGCSFPLCLHVAGCLYPSTADHSSSHHRPQLLTSGSFLSLPWLGTETTASPRPSRPAVFQAPGLLVAPRHCVASWWLPLTLPTPLEIALIKLSLITPFEWGYFLWGYCLAQTNNANALCES